MKLKILSWNIWCDCHFDHVVGLLEKSEADIIALQEVSFDDPDRDITTVLKNKGYHFVSGPSAEFTDSNNRHHVLNNAIFSKFPIVDSKVHVLKADTRPTTIEAQINIDNTKLTVFSIHIKHSHQQRHQIQDEQLETLLQISPSQHTIIMGDFNSVPDSYVVKKMEERFVSANIKQLPTWSVYPEGCPVCKPKKIDICLDYIFLTSDIKYGSFKVEESEGSDHLPVFLTIEV